MPNFNKRTVEEAKKLRVIDDAFFRLIGIRTEVCQEILRTLIDDDNLIVKHSSVQKSEVSLNRSLVLDALCELGDGTLCNIEMQKSDNNDDIKRVRFHASLITANHTPKKTEFKDIPNVKVIYIAEYDVLGNRQAVTHISRCQLHRKTYKPVNDGEDIFIANARSRQRNRQSHLLKLFLRSDSFYDEMYPELSKAVQHFKDSEKGRGEMYRSIEEYAKEREIDTAVTACIDFGKTLDETIEYVVSKFKDAQKDYIISRFSYLSGSAN